MNDVIPVDTPEIKKAQRAQVWWIRTALVGSMLTTVLVIGLVGFHFTDQAKQSTTQKAVQVAAQAARRADCKTEYNAYRTTIIEHRNTVAVVAQQDIIGYLLGQVGTEKLAANRTILDAANAAVDTLPPLNEMADKGYRDAAGVTHPPCPKVT